MIHHSLHMLVCYVNPQQLKQEGQLGPLTVVSHLPHFGHRRQSTVCYLVGADCDHASEVAVSEGVVDYGMVQTNG